MGLVLVVVVVFVTDAAVVAMMDEQGAGSQLVFYMRKSTTPTTNETEPTNRFFANVGPQAKCWNVCYTDNTGTYLATACGRHPIQECIEES